MSTDADRPKLTVEELAAQFRGEMGAQARTGAAEEIGAGHAAAQLLDHQGSIEAARGFAG
jgi:hypothetical protein